jgi:Leucine rich repeat
MRLSARFIVMIICASSLFSHAQKVSCCKIKLFWSDLGLTLSTFTRVDQIEVNSLSNDVIEEDLTIEGFVRTQEKSLKLLPEGIGESFPNLIAFEVSHCTVSTVEAKYFIGMENLVVIRLSSNEIDYIASDAFGRLSKLKTLNLAWNRIEHLSGDIFKPLSSLVRLNVNDNQIKYLDKRVFVSQANLLWLNLDKNLINELSQNILTSLVSLTHFSISNNQLETLHENLFIHNPKLQGIWLSGNKIKVLSAKVFDNKSALQQVDLSDNICVNSSYWDKSFGSQSSFESMRSDLIAKCQKQMNHSFSDSLEIFKSAKFIEVSTTKQTFVLSSKLEAFVILVISILMSFVLLMFALKVSRKLGF